MLYSEVFELRAKRFAEAAKAATAAAFAPGLSGFSRFYATLAAQQFAIEQEEMRAERAWSDEAQQDVWLNEGGREPDSSV